MITYLNKDITTVERGIIAHGCNCQGVMGSGVAKFLKDKYPVIFPKYQKICQKAADKQEDNLLGSVDFVNVAVELFVANCFTQHLYGYDKGKYARPEAIRDSLQVVYAIALLFGLPVYIPKIGAGRGGLSWEIDVEPIISKLATQHKEVHTYVCTWAE